MNIKDQLKAIPIDQVAERLGLKFTNALCRYLRKARAGEAMNVYVNSEKKRTPN